MEKVYKNKPVIDKNGRYSLEKVELDSIKAVLVELEGDQLGRLIALIQFQQRINNLFFDDNDKYETYQGEVDKALKELYKTKDAKETDLRKCERSIAKSLEDYCDINGKSLVLEIARKLCRNYSFRDIVSWTFSINEVYSDGMYDWMY